MTVDVLKIDKLAAMSLKLLEREIVLPNLVTVSSGAEFVGALDDTVTIRVPARTTAKKRDLRPATENARTIQLSNLTEQAITVTLDEDIYNAVGIEDEIATLDLVDFATQVLQPQVRAVALGWEDKIAAEITGATYVHEVEYDETKPYNTLIRARRLLQDSGVPKDGLKLVVGAGIEESLLTSDQLIKYDSSGDANALRTNTLGKIAGLEAVSSLAIPAGEAYLFHKSAFAMAWRAPVVPKGAVFGRSVALPGSNGVSLTWIHDYDFLQSRDRSLVHVYTGTNHTVDKPDAEAELDIVKAGGFLRAVKITGDGIS